MKKLYYDQARETKGIYRTVHADNSESGFSFGMFEFHSDGMSLVPFSHHGEEPSDRHIWEDEMFVNIDEIK